MFGFGPGLESGRYSNATKGIQLQDPPIRKEEEHLEASGAIEDPSWGMLGPFLRTLVQFWDRFSRFWGRFGQSWSILGRFWAILGPRVFKIAPAEFACWVPSLSCKLLGPTMGSNCRLKFAEFSLISRSIFGPVFRPLFGQLLGPFLGARFGIRLAQEGPRCDQEGYQELQSTGTCICEKIKKRRFSCFRGPGLPKTASKDKRRLPSGT